MTHASLFSGIGGFDLAAEWAGWENLFNCEVNGFCSKVLKYHFPNTKQYNDIRTTNFAVWRGRVDVLTGGFPCQPFSLAGSRKGTEDERYLWPEMLRAIREIRPRFVVGENVYGIINWSDGMVFEQVCADLEHEGYEVWAYILPAAGVGAPHRRDRVWFVAHRFGVERHARRPESAGFVGPSGGADGGNDAKNAERVRCDGQDGKTQSDQRQQREFGAGDNRRLCRAEGLAAGSDDAPYAPLDGCRQGCGEGREVRKRGVFQGKCKGREQHRSIGSTRPIENQGRQPRRPVCSQWEQFPTQPPVYRGDDGFSDRLDFDAVFAGIKRPRRHNIFGRWRVESIQAYGNAIVPQVAYQIFKAINLTRNER